MMYLWFQLEGVNYEKLRNLLAAGKWKEADQETMIAMKKLQDELGKIG